MHGRGDDAWEGRRCVGGATIHRRGKSRIAHNKAAARGRNLWAIGTRRVDKGRAMSGRRELAEKSSSAISSILCAQSLRFVYVKSRVKSSLALWITSSLRFDVCCTWRLPFIIHRLSILLTNLVY